MAVFKVLNDGSAGATGLTLQQAIDAAAAEPGDHTIRFGTGVSIVQLDDVLGIGGKITIDGDSDGDGVSDVVIRAAYHMRHMTVDAGADVIIRNVDFIGGYEFQKSYEGLERLPAEKGWGGSAGTTTDQENFMDGAVGNDDAGDALDGEDGIDGLDAVGSILNRGMLTLERVGFGANFARGENAQSGGTGGWGGTSNGGDGLTDYLDGYNDGPLSPDKEIFHDELIAGGNGGDGGRGGNGGDGGDGGKGGSAAGAILNEGDLTLTDVVFSGRLSSGFVAGGNNAYGGYPGLGGGGGIGGYSYGGDGGNSGRQVYSKTSFFYEAPDDKEGFSGPYVSIDGKLNVWVSINTIETAPAGTGGDGGIPGQGGNGGRGGDSGDAATVLNRGTVSGNIAVIDYPKFPDLFQNVADTYDGGRGGYAGMGGRSFGGLGGREFGPVDWYQNGTGLHYAVTTFPHASWLDDAWSAFRRAYPDMDTYWGSSLVDEGTAADGVSLPDGAAGTAGYGGDRGKTVTGVSDDGVSSVKSNNALVYAHSLGQDTKTGELAFNVIRMGQVSNKVEVSWKLVGIGDNKVSQADFEPGTELSGVLTFKPSWFGDFLGEEDPKDGIKNVQTVVLRVAGDGLRELPEGYRFVLTEVTGKTLLGTKVLEGTIKDTMIPYDGPIVGTAKADRLVGTGKDDEISGLSGDDTLIGKAGNDDLRGDNGNDLLKGAGGNDTLAGGNGDDTLNGGKGRDTFVFDAGADVITNFQDDRDMVIFAHSLAKGELTKDMLAGIVVEKADALVFGFGDNVLTVRGISSFADIKDDLGFA